MREVQQHWPFLTNFDASTVRNELQLVALVKDRSGQPRPRAQADVQAWMAGKDF